MFSMIIVRIGLGLMAPTGETRNLSTHLSTRDTSGKSGMRLGPFAAARGATTTTTGTSSGFEDRHLAMKELNVSHTSESV